MTLAEISSLKSSPQAVGQAASFCSRTMHHSRQVTQRSLEASGERVESSYRSAHDNQGDRHSVTNDGKNAGEDKRNWQE